MQACYVSKGGFVIQAFLICALAQNLNFRQYLDDAGLPCEQGSYCSTGQADATGGYCQSVLEAPPAQAPAPAPGSGPSNGPSSAPSSGPSAELVPPPSSAPAPGSSVTSGQAYATSGENCAHT